VSAAIPVIFITEKDVYRERLAMMNKGVRHVVGKPVRPYEMSQIVQETLHDRNFVVRDKSCSLAELTLTAGKRKAVIEAEEPRPRLEGDGRIRWARFCGIM
jgi:DNA-binding response OmpR family regulator